MMVGNTPQLVEDVNPHTFTEPSVQLKCPGKILQDRQHAKPGSLKDSRYVNWLVFSVIIRRTMLKYDFIRSGKMSWENEKTKSGFQNLEATPGERFTMQNTYIPVLPGECFMTNRKVCPCISLPVLFAPRNNNSETSYIWCFLFKTIT